MMYLTKAHFFNKADKSKLVRIPKRDKNGKWTHVWINLEDWYKKEERRRKLAAVKKKDKTTDSEDYKGKGRIKGQGSNWLNEYRRMGLYHRDKHRCCYCGKKDPEPGAWSIDLTGEHIIPVSTKEKKYKRSGLDEEGNIDPLANISYHNGKIYMPNVVTCCGTCNSIRKDRDQVDFFVDLLLWGFDLDKAVERIEKQIKKPIDTDAADRITEERVAAREAGKGYTAEFVAKKHKDRNARIKRRTARARAFLIKMGIIKKSLLGSAYMKKLIGYVIPLAKGTMEEFQKGEEPASNIPGVSEVVRALREARDEATRKFALLQKKGNLKVPKAKSVDDDDSELDTKKGHDYFVKCGEARAVEAIGDEETPGKKKAKKKKGGKRSVRSEKALMGKGQDLDLEKGRKPLDKTGKTQKTVQYKTKTGKIATRHQWVGTKEDKAEIKELKSRLKLTGIDPKLRKKYEA
jgi:5-methylcytosine-specific restriction endonuclease McrA